MDMFQPPVKSQMQILFGKSLDQIQEASGVSAASRMKNADTAANRYSERIDVMIIQKTHQQRNCIIYSGYNHELAPLYSAPFWHQGIRFRNLTQAYMVYLLQFFGFDREATKVGSKIILIVLLISFIQDYFTFCRFKKCGN
jgi:hypothetical protein